MTTDVAAMDTLAVGLAESMEQASRAVVAEDAIFASDREYFLRRLDATIISPLREGVVDKKAAAEFITDDEDGWRLVVLAFEVSRRAFQDGRVVAMGAEFDRVVEHALKRMWNDFRWVMAESVDPNEILVTSGIRAVGEVLERTRSSDWGEQADLMRRVAASLGRLGWSQLSDAITLVLEAVA